MSDSVAGSMSVDGTDHSLIRAEHDSCVGDHPDQMGTHPTIEATQALILPHLQQCLHEGVVLALITRHLLPEPRSAYLCKEERNPLEPVHSQGVTNTALQEASNYLQLNHYYSTRFTFVL